jgi:hypothetical protein
MHVGSAIDVIEKQGHIKAHKEAHEAYVKQPDLAQQAKAALAELDGTTSKGAGASKKSSKKHKETVAIADASEPACKLFIDWISIRRRECQGQGKISCSGHVPVLRKLAVCGC